VIIDITPEQLRDAFDGKTVELGKMEAGGVVEGFRLPDGRIIAPGSNLRRIDYPMDTLPPPPPYRAIRHEDGILWNKLGDRDLIYISRDYDGPGCGGAFDWRADIEEDVGADVGAIMLRMNDHGDVERWKAGVPGYSRDVVIVPGGVFKRGGIWACATWEPGDGVRAPTWEDMAAEFDRQRQLEVINRHRDELEASLRSTEEWMRAQLSRAAESDVPIACEDLVPAEYEMPGAIADLRREVERLVARVAVLEKEVAALKPKEPTMNESRAIKKALAASTVAVGLVLGGCQSTSTGGGISDPSGIIAQVQALARGACRFVPTAATVAEILAAGNPAVSTASAVAGAVCAAVQSSAPTVASRAVGALAAVAAAPTTICVSRKVAGVTVCGERV